MTKLTKAQRSALEWGGGVITYSPSIGQAWATASNGTLLNVRLSTFNALCLGRLIKTDTPLQTARSIYRLTPAGLAALQEQTK
jgi:DNA-binding PadR family transcriptional regulator